MAERVVIVVGPIGLPDLPGLATQKECVRSLEHGHQEGAHLGVGRRGGPSATVEPPAPVLVRPARALVYAVQGQHHRGSQLHGQLRISVAVHTSFVVAWRWTTDSRGAAAACYGLERRELRVSCQSSDS